MNVMDIGNKLNITQIKVPVCRDETCELDDPTQRGERKKESSRRQQQQFQQVSEKSSTWRLVVTSIHIYMFKNSLYSHI